MDLVAALSMAPLADCVFVVASDVLCVVAIGLTLTRPSAVSLVSRGYGARLLRPWRLATFVLSAAVFTLGAPYMGNPTWDRPVGAMMSGFTYLLAPWVTGTLFRLVRPRPKGPSANGGDGSGATSRPSAREVGVAVAGWLLAVSACYETYLVFRDGRLPPTTWSNLVTSSAAFFAAGLFWSLGHVSGRGVVFGFMLPDWPRDREEQRVAPRMVAIGLLIAVVVGLVLVPFFLQMARP